MLKWFKQKLEKPQELYIYVKLNYKHPEFFDEKKITENIDAYFNTYFKQNPLSKTLYKGIRIIQFGGSGPFSDECSIRFVFDDHAKILINDQQRKVIKSNLAEITGIEINIIILDFLTLSELHESMGSAQSILDNFNRAQEIDNELDQANKELEKLNIDMQKEQSPIGKAYDKLRESGLTDPKWDQMIDDLEEEKRKQQAKFNQMRNVSEEFYVFSEKVNQVHKELEEYNLKREEEFSETQKLYNLHYAEAYRGTKFEELINEYEEKSRKELARFDQIKYEYKDYLIINEGFHESLLGLEKIRMQLTIDIPQDMRRLPMLKDNCEADSKVYKDYLKMTESKIDKVVELENDLKKRKKW